MHRHDGRRRCQPGTDRSAAPGLSAISATRRPDSSAARNRDGSCPLCPLRWIDPQPIGSREPPPRRGGFRREVTAHHRRPEAVRRSAGSCRDLAAVPQQQPARRRRRYWWRRYQKRRTSAIAIDHFRFLATTFDPGLGWHGRSTPFWFPPGMTEVRPAVSARHARGVQSVPRNSLKSGSYLGSVVQCRPTVRSACTGGSRSQTAKAWRLLGRLSMPQR